MQLLPGGGCMQQDDPDVLSPPHLDPYPETAPTTTTTDVWTSEV